jgi:methionyl-tRNA synthetase
MKPFYITTTLPYVNAEPHIGFALEIVTADVIARYKQMHGYNVIFNTGTDEHGQKIYSKALENNKKPQAYVDEYAAKFKDLKKLLNLSITHFVRTTDPHHILAAQEFWKRCDKNGDIYKKLYSIKYCVGCELEKTESELVDGHCPLHPKMHLDAIEEENYFFKFSRYQQQLLSLYKSGDFVKPDTKLKEIIGFVEHGLQDFSISRLKTKMPWGIDVPGDDTQVMYVWFDALVNYISTIGWPDDLKSFETYWPGSQIAGKDNLRQQAAMWQAMLLSAQLPTSKQILINDFISVEGQKMSKSMGNVISPGDMIARYGVDGTRYLLLSLGPINTDMDVSWRQFDERFNGYLANALGNTIQRVATLCARSGYEFLPDNPPGFRSQVKDNVESLRFDQALDEIFQTIKIMEKNIGEAKPWTMSGNPLKIFLTETVAHLRQVGYELQPFLPETAERILTVFKGPTISIPKPLFPRLQ